MSPFLLCSKWLGMQIFSLLSTQFPSVTPACFRPLSSKSFFVLALQMGSRMSSSCSSFYSPYNCLVCRSRKRQTSPVKYFTCMATYIFMIYFTFFFLHFYFCLVAAWFSIFANSLQGRTLQIYVHKHIIYKNVTVTLISILFSFIKEGFYLLFHLCKAHWACTVCQKLLWVTALG